jgi:hypothetical protein
MKKDADQRHFEKLDKYRKKGRKRIKKGENKEGR